MKTSKWIYLCVLFLFCIGSIGWTTYASGQPQKGEAEVQQEFQKYMPLLKGSLWVKADHKSKIAFLWGVAHVVLIEQVLMEEVPELRVENFCAKVIEARRARVSAGTAAMTFNEAVQKIDQYYKDHPDQLEVPVLRVIWDVAIKPSIKTGIGGRPLK